MTTLLRFQKFISSRICRRSIALVQVVVMVMLAVPACCYELESAHEKTGISQAAKVSDADHDKCPCCPEENNADADTDSCSTCDYCSFYAPLIPFVSTSYDPAMAQLMVHEQFTKPADIHIPIYVPPQNLA